MIRAVPLFVLLSAATALAGTVKMRDGTTRSGDLQLEHSDLVLVSAKTPVTIPLDQVAGVSFENDPPPQAVTDVGAGALKAEYFLGAQFDPAQRKLIRSESGLDGRWDGPGNNPFGDAREFIPFCVRWTGQVRPLYSERYSFDVGAQDSTRVWIDHRLILDGRAEMGKGIRLDAGRKYDIRIDQIARPRPFTLAWESASQPHGVIPANCLFVRGDDPEASAVVTMKSPADQTVLMGKEDCPVSVRVDPGSHHIGRLDVLDNGNLLEKLSGPPFSFTWKTVPSGTHLLTARAYEDNGRQWPSSAVTLNRGDDNGGALPKPWCQAGIGTIAQQSSQYENDTATLQAQGGELYAGADKLEFMFQALSGDGEITAKIAEVQPAAATAPSHPVAGIMIRASLRADSVAATIGFSPTVGSVFVSRNQTANGSTSVTSSQNAPGYVRLIRHGNHIRGYRSIDGDKWEFLGEVEAQLPPAALVGTVISAQADDARATASFANVKVATHEAIPVKQSAGTGIELIDGSLLYGWFRVNDRNNVVTFELGVGDVPKPRFDFPGESIARVLYRPTDYSEELTDPNVEGLVLSNGDVCEGKIINLWADSAKVISTLVGPKQIHRNEGLAMALIRPLAPKPATYEITTRGGARILAQQVAIKNGELVATSALLGQLRLPAAIVAGWKTMEGK